MDGITIIVSDSEDEVSMWVDEPTVVNIGSSDEEESNSQKLYIKAELEKIESDALKACMSDLNSDSNSDDEVSMWVNEPTVVVVSSDEDEKISKRHNTQAELENSFVQSNSLQEDSYDINEKYKRRFTHFDDRLGAVDTAQINKPVYIYGVTRLNNNFRYVKRDNRHSSGRSYPDVAASDVSSKSSRWSDCTTDKSHKAIQSERSGIDRDKRFHRIKKRKSSGSNRNSYKIKWDNQTEKNRADQETYKDAGHTEVNSNFRVAETKRPRYPSPNLADESDWDLEIFKDAGPKEVNSNLSVEETKCPRYPSPNLADESDWDEEIFKDAGRTEINSNLSSEKTTSQQYPCSNLAEESDWDDCPDANNDASRNSHLPASSVPSTQIPTPNYQIANGGNQDSANGVEKTGASQMISHITQKETDGHPNDIDKPETTEMKKLSESKSFSFMSEMDKLARVKFISFIASQSDGSEDICSPNQNGTNSSISQSNIKRRKSKSHRPVVMEFSELGEARIVITKPHHARLLLSNESGYNFLNDAHKTHSVSIRMEWESDCNVLVVVGTYVNQKRFHDDLIVFLEDTSRNKSMANFLPRNKVSLVSIIRQQYNLLETSETFDVNEQYAAMKRNESIKTKDGSMKADDARRNLNIVLMGRAGLGSGKIHLAELGRKFKMILDDKNERLVARKLLDEISNHYNYIFSSYRHDNYPALISEYEELKKTNSLPALDWDPALYQTNGTTSGTVNCAKRKLIRSFKK